jgi:hypothetical protein
VSSCGVCGEEVEVLFFGEIGKGIESIPESIPKVVHVQVVVVDFLAVVNEYAQSVFLLLNQIKKVLRQSDTSWSGAFSIYGRGIKNPCPKM